MSFCRTQAVFLGFLRLTAALSAGEGNPAAFLQSGPPTAIFFLSPAYTDTVSLGGETMAQQLERKAGTAQLPAGLTEAEVRASREAHGSNRLSRQKTKPFWRQFLGNLNDPVIRILLAALAVNLLLLVRGSDWIETAGIGLAVFLATLISTLSERSSERAFARLSEEGDRTVCRVRRAGGVTEIPIAQVVCGDSVLLSAGECIPADGVLTAGALKVDQSPMTGESREVEKRAWSGSLAGHRQEPSDPCSLFRGCSLTAGGGEMLVTSVGDATFLGQISREVQLEQRDSPLKRRLGKLARQISIIGYVAAVLVALSYLFHVFLLDSGMRADVIRLKLNDLNYVLASLFHAFTLGLTVIVVAVPEGLPMMIAVVLSANVRKMVRDQVLVRKPVGIEAAGSMDLLFTDKTGTLTEGKMSVVSLLFAGGETFRDLPTLRRRCGACTADLLSLGLRCGGATLDAGGRPVGGSATERALLDFVAGEPVPESCGVISALPFDSARKYSAVTWAGHGDRPVTVLLGAPELLLSAVRGAMTPEGGTAGHFSRAGVLSELHRMNAGGGRGVAVAVCTDPSVRAQSLSGGIRGDFRLLGILELSDPVRADAPGAVRDLLGAGVQVVMVTGDSRGTAQAIAGECGILCGSQDLILTSDELAGMSDLQLKELLPRLAVVARALPTDKSRLVRLAQESGRVVGMTGDGINDAPALRRADVGFAMGAGTQVAKDAGDIVILDDRLSSIVRAVLYGRTVFKSIRKFITLQLTMNFSAVGVTMICPFLGIDSPVTVVQMLWINLIMDTLGGLAFAGEAPLASDMREKPKKRDEGILNRYMVNEIALLGGMTVAVCLLFLKHPLLTSQFRQTDGSLCLLTAFFALFIFSSVFNCFNARTDRLSVFAGLGRNPVFIGIMTAVLTIQLLFVYLGGAVLRTMPLTPRELGLTMLISLSVFPLEFLRKLLWRLLHGRTGY